MPVSLVKLEQLLRNAHRRAKLHHSPRPEAVASEVIEPDGYDRYVHPVLVQSAERDYGHTRLRKTGIKAT